jgi:hypothetical protein
VQNAEAFVRVGDECRKVLVPSQEDSENGREANESETDPFHPRAHKNAPR